MRFIITKMQLNIFFKNNLVVSSSSSYLKIYLLKGILNYKVADCYVSYIYETLLNHLIENSLLDKMVYSNGGLLIRKNVHIFSQS